MLAQASGFKAVYLSGGGVAANSLGITKKVVTTTDPPTPYEVVTTFNNFYDSTAISNDRTTIGKS
jgi:2-methylisocitrate lyase-like PEP mutase family enzyme